MILIGMWPLQQPGTTEPRISLPIPGELMARIWYIAPEDFALPATPIAARGFVDDHC